MDHSLVCIYKMFMAETVHIFCLWQRCLRIWCGFYYFFIYCVA